MPRKGVEPLILVAMFLVVFVALWLGSRKLRSGRIARVTVRTDADARVVIRQGEAEAVVTVSAPRIAPQRPVPRVTVPPARAAPLPRATILADQAVPVRRSRSARASATNYMLRRRGLCSPDPHP